MLSPSLSRKCLPLSLLSATFALFICFASAARAQSALDGFDPNANNSVNAVAVQADGKIVVGGTFTLIGGQSRSKIARLNPDGSLDAAFNPTIFTTTVSAIVVQPNGAILVGREGADGLVRLNADGSRDTNFNPNASDSVTAIALQTDGKILVTGFFGLIGGQARSNFARLNTDGTVDSFNANLNQIAFAVAVQTDGKILIGGAFSNPGTRIARFNSNGSLDGSFTAIPDGTIRTITLQADNKAIITGQFTNVGGSPRNNIARLNTNGSVDASFNPLVNGGINAVAIQRDGKILISGGFSTINGIAHNNLARLNPDSSPDAAFNPNGGASLAIVVQPDDKIIIGGTFSTINGATRNNIARLYENGSLDATLNPNVNGEVFAVAAQADGKILIGGDFTTVGGQTRTALARLNSDGTLDNTFNANITNCCTTNLRHILLLPDGKILIGGTFSNVGSFQTYNVARLNADGSADTTFTSALNGGSGTVIDVERQSDGKILIAGSLGTVGGTANRIMLRLNTDGSNDSSFNNVTVDSGGVLDIALQTNGKILIGGTFFTVNGTIRRNFAQLNTDGTLDTTLSAVFTGAVYAVKLQTDGKILVGGTFDSVNATNRNKIARLNTDGTLDTAFNPNSTFQNGVAVEIITIQADGKVLVGGSFTSISGQPRNRLARFNADGSLDSFNPDADQIVDALAIQEDGKILVGGNFNNIGGQSRSKIARLTNDTPTVQTLVVSQTMVSLTINGAGPQLSRVRFEYSTDGVNYTFLGEATASRAASDISDESKMSLAPTATTFTLTGLNLPTAQNVFIRANGFDANGSEVTGAAKNAVLAAPTAASVSISGRVSLPQDLGLTNASVTLTDSRGDSQTVRTGKFGNFRFTSVATGETYILTVTARRYTFAPQVINVTEDITELNFAPQ